MATQQVNSVTACKEPENFFAVATGLNHKPFKLILHLYILSRTSILVSFHLWQSLQLCLFPWLFPTKPAALRGPALPCSDF
jgi:hypothetical protein